jgi:uncharacterized protein YbjT (DUF2867 family)
MSRTVLITGATGTVSGALMDALSDADVDLRALVRDEAKAQGIESRGVQVRVADLGTPESLPGAFEGVNDLWLLNANSPCAPEHSINAVWAARHAGVQRVVRMSAVGAAHDAPTRSGRLHALADNQLENSGLAWTILRPHFFMQNLLDSVDTIIEQNAFYLNAGEGRIGAIDVRDVAEIATKILTDEPDRHHAKVYTPTGPEAISFTQVAAHLGEATGNDVSYVAVPDDAARQAMLDAGLSEWLAGMLVEYGQAFSTGWSDYTTNDVKELLGRPPRRFADFARDHAAAFTSKR